MKIHEYQAESLLRQYGIPTPGGTVAGTPEEALRTAAALGFPVVLKAQVHVGGRGKAGGVKLAKNADEVALEAKSMLGMTIKGLPVRKLLVTSAVHIAREVYLSILIDRGARKATFIGCAEGGVEIEATAKESPHKILRLEVPANLLRGIAQEEVLPFARRLLPEDREVAPGAAGRAEQAGDIMLKMARLFVEKDCSLVEINPLIADDAGRVLALDAKILLDDNALFRHGDLLELRDPDSEDRDELRAKEDGLSFIRLSGSIGCMVNGAGLAMATMDTIKHLGGQPANFLDVGGSSSPRKVVSAFRLILSDPRVRVILINIFGGITRCDDIARGILASLADFNLSIPIVVRLVGTNEAEARALLSGTDLIPADTLEDAARKAVAIAAGRASGEDG